MTGHAPEAPPWHAGGGLPALSAPGLARLWALLFLSSLVLLLCARAARADTGGIEVEAADFVIVGGGTAGCVIAARLCQRFGDASILLLERGQERNQTEEESVRAVRAPSSRLPLLNACTQNALGGCLHRVLRGTVAGHCFR